LLRTYYFVKSTQFTISRKVFLQYKREHYLRLQHTKATSFLLESKTIQIHSAGNHRMTRTSFVAFSYLSQHGAVLRSVVDMAAIEDGKRLRIASASKLAVRPWANRLMLMLASSNVSMPACVKSIGTQKTRPHYWMTFATLREIRLD
jgi:hypothetical protein